ncbi:hypothetical protein VNO77_08030 [Canavalia gladiata]|uniref:Uncharacterized protein n=1 Tax=Canavalia gladiata TaxID=3824 RepID=A0AAN9QWW8_CANGL
MDGKVGGTTLILPHTLHWYIRPAWLHCPFCITSEGKLKLWFNLDLWLIHGYQLILHPVLSSMSQGIQLVGLGGSQGEQTYVNSLR